jgi:23S rRNA (cytosine1962-C5)-methyltransferase
LFLYQRERRDWVKNHCKDKRVLNLFAFTCGFSLAAASGGATEVISVDLSKKYLNWGRENFELNGFDPNEDKFRWMAMDSIDYLTWSQKKGFKYDIIVCDPPSFSRHKKSKKTFKIDRDFADLIKLCLERLNPKGILLFSTNFEKWRLEQWTQQIEKKNFPIKKLQVSSSQWDYEWQSKDAGLKAFFLRKA